MKAKDQALPGAKLSAVLAKVEAALFANVLFQSVARPKSLTKLILSRYRTGKTYTLHVDNTLMKGVADGFVLYAVPVRPCQLRGRRAR